MLESVPLLELTDTVTIGGATAEGPYAFGSIVAAALLDDGRRIVVADDQTEELHLFDLSGRHLMSLGGRGGGPGEHRALRSVRATSGGGFCTWDVQVSRATRFASDGRVVSTATADLDGFEAFLPSLIGFFDECAFVLRDRRSPMGMRDEPEGMRRDTVRFVLFDRSGLQVRTLARLPGAEYWFRNRGGSWGRVQPIFGEELFGVTLARTLWVGLSERALWRRFDRSGDTLDAVDLEHRPRTATDLEIAAERERLLGGVEAGPGLARIDGGDVAERFAEAERAGIREVTARDRIPAYDALVAGVAGLWVRRHPRPAESEGTWLFVDPSGAPVGRLRLPRDEHVLDGSDRVVLVGTTDELDAPVLRILVRR